MLGIPRLVILLLAQSVNFGLYTMQSSDTESCVYSGVLEKVTNALPKCKRPVKKFDFASFKVKFFAKKQEASEWVLIDDSVETGELLSFQIGGDSVLPVLHCAAIAMCVGETKELWIPPESGYGERVLFSIV